MPYIKKKERTISTKECPENAGQLNFAITHLIIDYCHPYRDSLSYQVINDVIGALEGAKAEFQRRVVAPYEDKKIKENGDVYPLELTGSNK